MSKQSPEYIAEGKRRNEIRKQKRNDNYRDLARKANEHNCPIYYIKTGSSWDDENSPTGMSQRCEMGGVCQSPCNGDC